MTRHVRPRSGVRNTSTSLCAPTLRLRTSRFGSAWSKRRARVVVAEERAPGARDPVAAPAPVLVARVAERVLAALERRVDDHGRAVGADRDVHRPRAPVPGRVGVDAVEVGEAQRQVGERAEPPAVGAVRRVALDPDVVEARVVRRRMAVGQRGDDGLARALGVLRVRPDALLQLAEAAGRALDQRLRRGPVAAVLRPGEVRLPARPAHEQVEPRAGLDEVRVGVAETAARAVRDAGDRPPVAAVASRPRPVAHHAVAR